MNWEEASTHSVLSPLGTTRRKPDKRGAKWRQEICAMQCAELICSVSALRDSVSARTGSKNVDHFVHKGSA
jgi:hypothetical protein